MLLSREDYMDAAMSRKKLFKWSSPGRYRNRRVDILFEKKKKRSRRTPQYRRRKAVIFGIAEEE